ncbi:hypothetical protein AAZX31_10G044800 [Glycine max]|uniref:SCP domain-containing protein n=1 Tax=Glycine max TaxID=3847 RepID=K7LHG3_SOYBN|nr:pathogenesis-related protein PR-1 [Glycine max]KAH1136776.1 hypothetical protein GYH30_026976 [Glycine max]KAH1227589.1 Pathogenesis-related protein 1A [Glycine max]KRH32362.1 hypothetical protein GLYMA_10G047000v4 [Glycine max]|eukprot:XP_006588735.1 pathogenesis-related protein PR-1 [Glycine max]
MTYTMRPFLFSILFTFLATVFAQPLQPSSTPTSFPIDSNAPQRSSPQTPPATSFPADSNAPQQPSPQTPPATSFPADSNAPNLPSPSSENRSLQGVGRHKGGHHSGRRKRVNTRKYFGYVPQTNDTSFTNQTALAQEFLHAHNWIRKQYNLPEYTWDEKLASYARGYLMQRYEDCKLVHSNSNYGENVFWGKKLHWSPSDATYYWYQEKQWYNFQTLSCAPPPKACGHFTQVVWRDSQRIGCALQHCHNPSLGMLIACEYDPAGNYENEDPLKQHER